MKSIDRLSRDYALAPSARTSRRKTVISRQQGPVWPNRGNSFWLSNKEGVWYLCTWAPEVYRVAPR